MATQWTQERIDKELADIDGGGIAYGSKDPAVSGRNFLFEVVRQLLRDQQPAVSYRLRIPGAEALHDIEVIERLGSETLVRLLADDDPTHRLPVPHGWLVEVRPPSIEDPVELPLAIKAVRGGGHVVVEEPTASQVEAGAVLRVLDWPIDADGARELARAAWRAADGGAS